MQNAESLTAEQISEFLKASGGIEFTGQSRAEVYAWTERMGAAGVRRARPKATRCDPGIFEQGRRAELGTDHAAGAKVRADRKSGAEALPAAPLSAEVPPGRRRVIDGGGSGARALSGPATQCILKREHQEFGKKDFVRLAGISVSHLYNLRASLLYRKHAAVFESTRPSPVSIGERRKPDPQGQPGFLRVDTVHPGDWNGAKGVYHIHAVDTVPQWQVVGSSSKISEQFLLPVLEAMLHQFPFRILGFHADNGSEFINHTVARLLEKLRVEFTKSRAYRTTDNALVEGKNGAIILGLEYAPRVLSHTR
jgi:hypothetical protein